MNNEINNDIILDFGWLCMYEFKIDFKFETWETSMVHTIS